MSISLFIRSSKLNLRGLVAQRIERLRPKEGVGGSSPSEVASIFGLGQWLTATRDEKPFHCRNSRPERSSQALNSLGENLCQEAIKTVN